MADTDFQKEELELEKISRLSREVNKGKLIAVTLLQGKAVVSSISRSIPLLNQDNPSRILKSISVTNMSPN